MADKSWKALERRIATAFGCTRRGPIFRSVDGGTDDCTHPLFSIECKLLSRPTYGEMFAACVQAELSGREVVVEGEIVRHARTPIAVVKKKGARDSDAIVCMRLESFLRWQGEKNA